MRLICSPDTGEPVFSGIALAWPASEGTKCIGLFRSARAAKQADAHQQMESDGSVLAQSPTSSPFHHSFVMNPTAGRVIFPVHLVEDKAEPLTDLDLECRNSELYLGWVGISITNLLSVSCQMRPIFLFSLWVFTSIT